MYCFTMLSGAPPADPAKYEPDHRRCARQSPGHGDLRREVHDQVDLVGVAVELPLVPEHRSAHGVGEGVRVRAGPERARGSARCRR
jgi:hypothetical protein